MEFNEKTVGKTIKNKHTGETTYVISYADRPSVQLANGVGFCVHSPCSEEWELI